jgi:ClpP class serine protease
MILFPFRYLWWLVSSARRSIGAPPAFVIFVLENDLPALPDPPRPLWQRFTSRPRLSLTELGDRFDAIARDPRIKGVVLHLRPVGMPMATLQDLRELVDKLRKSGKRVVAWAPFYSTGTYYLACGCDEILLMPVGAIQPLGFATTGMFLRDGLARFGVEADFVQISPYKSAADVFTKSKMSDELREQVTWLLDSQNKELLRAIAEGRLRDEKGAQQLVDGSPYGDDAALEARAVDALVPEETLAERLGQGASGPVAIGTWERAQSKMRSPAPTLGRGKYVAVLRIEGTIVDGRSGGLPVKPPIEVPLLGDDRAGDLTVVQAARQVAGDSARGGGGPLRQLERRIRNRVGGDATGAQRDCGTQAACRRHGPRCSVRRLLGLDAGQLDSRPARHPDRLDRSADREDRDRRRVVEAHIQPRDCGIRRARDHRERREALHGRGTRDRQGSDRPHLQGVPRRGRQGAEDDPR